MQKATTLSLRTSPEFAQITGAYARLLGLSKSRYVEEAIKEKNARSMTVRLQQLSRELSAKSLNENDALDATIGDGLG